MLQYKAGYKFVEGGVHAQVLDLPAAITCGSDLAEARHLLAVALVDVAETSSESGQPLPVPDPLISYVEMDLEEPISLHLKPSTAVEEVPAGVIAPSSGKVRWAFPSLESRRGNEAVPGRALSRPA